ncbi:MAG TPA: type II toxin-antitoxin system RelE/ParE family toxin [archaeon]|nr:type II toxin-antitoxin system RelE/ParE family toxin [archaeon]
MSYTPKFTDRFLEDTKRLKGELRNHLEKAVRKILENPQFGKPLRHTYKGLRSERVGKFRIIYEIEGNLVIFHIFEHRKEVYKK